MHSESRRLSAQRRERTWHAKRLGQVQPVNDSYASPLVFAENATTPTTPATTSTPSASPAKTTTTTTTTPSPATASTPQAKTSSAVVSSASASSSTLQTSTSSVSSPTSTLTTPSITTSSTNNHAATGLSSSSSNTSQSVVLITTSPSPTTNTNNASASGASSQLSGGALGGIIAASVVVSLALLIFIVRKTYLRRRQTRRISWPDGNIFSETKPLPAAPMEDFYEEPTLMKNAPTSPFDAYGQQVYGRQPPRQSIQSPLTGYAAPAPPDPSYNNPTPVYPRYPTLNPKNPDAIVSMARAAAGASSNPTPAAPPRLKTDAEAFVSRAFIPSLPDELSITGGERIRVAVLYDDGWALCVNGRGEQGMVPQECLDQQVASDGGDWRNARRMSSLTPDGRRL